MSATTAASTSQRYASTVSMMRFSIALLAFLERGSKKLRLEDETSPDHDLLAALEALADWCLAIRRFRGFDGAHGEAIRSDAHEYHVLAVDLLDCVGWDKDGHPRF